jgi:hypothetical protein
VRRPRLAPLALGLLVLALLPAALAAQGPAESYAQRFTEVMNLAPTARRVATVSGFVLERDRGRFTLESGMLYLLTPVGGRTVAAQFKGRGRFALTPPSAIERARLRRFSGADSLVTGFTDLVLFFADSTEAELVRRLSFGPGEPPSSAGPIRRALDYEGDEKHQYLDPDIMEVMLNGQESDMFHAYLAGGDGDPWMFSVNPSLVEGVQLSRRARGTGFTRISEVAAQFPRLGAPPARVGGGERTRQAEVSHYAIETRLPRTGAGNVNFSAVARMDITSAAPIGPWVAFALYYKLEVDSARWKDGTPAVVFKGKESPALWVNLGTPLGAGETRTLELFYHGDLVDRFGEWFFIKSSASWYPRALEGRSAATFELTYHTPKSYLFASAGELVDSVESNGTVTTRWVAPAPIRNASFNLGRFEHFPFEGPAGMPVTLLFSEAGHRELSGSAGSASRMTKQVGEDIASSMKFFHHVFGEPQMKAFYATEIPYGHGEAFPGLIHLSFMTFMGAADKELWARQGMDEWFRAHEVAHQWWGIGVDFSTYHDQWLSEGFASFAGLWYLQTARKDNTKYFEMLSRWRNEISRRGTEPGPVWLGYRAARINQDDNDYNLIVYQKGAWVVHMLRILMLDMKTMSEDRFTNMMRDFFATYRGKRASTDDFRRIVEKHAGTDMGWFFDQWVREPAIPTWRVSHRTEPVDGGKYRMTLRVDQENVPETFRMYVPVTVDLGGKQVVRARVQVTGRSSRIELPLLPAQPKSVRFNDFEGALADVKMVSWSD